MADRVEVKVGQVWESCDPRDGASPGRPARRIEVLQVGGMHAHVRSSTTGVRTRILLHRFRPGSTGWRLVEPPEVARSKLAEKVARAIDPKAWAFIDRARAAAAKDGKEHLALAPTIAHQRAQAARAIAGMTEARVQALTEALSGILVEDAARRVASGLADRLAANAKAAQPVVAYLHYARKKPELRELSFDAQPTMAQRAAGWITRPLVDSDPQAGSWIAAADLDRLVRQLDVALNGEAGAAPQAMLCDVVAQVESATKAAGRPLLATPKDAPALPVICHWPNCGYDGVECLRTCPGAKPRAEG